MTFDPNMIPSPSAKIKVIGVGGGGTNAVSTMVKENIEGVEFIAANTDIQSLKSALAPTKIQIGKELTKGLGAGANPNIGRDAALEDRFEIQEAIGDADMVFITAGMGGGTGTGSAAIVSQIAREMGALTVGVVTKPFHFEGQRRRRHAQIGIESLKEHVDTLITIPNQKLLQIASPDLTMVAAFQMADTVLVNAVKGISDIINVPGTINVDFADVKTIMSNMGQALMGIGVASGEGRAIEAAKQAVSSPLLEEIDIEGATGVLINITAGDKISLLEVNEACLTVQEAAHEDANVIFGVVIDEGLGDHIKVTVIATGFPTEEQDELAKKDSDKNKLLSEISGFGGQNLIIPHKKRAITPSPRTTLTQTTKPLEQTKAEPKPFEVKKPTEQTNLFFSPKAPQTEAPSSSAQTTTTTAATTPKQTVTNEMSQTPVTPSAKPLENQQETKTQQEWAPKEDAHMPTSQAPGQTPLQQAQENSRALLTRDMPPQVSQTTQSTQEPVKVDEKTTTEDIDKKIDDALQLAQRIKEIPVGEDDLDIPAFLRQNLEGSKSDNT